MDLERIEIMFGSIEENMTQINRKLDNVIIEMNQLKKENIKLNDQVLKQEDRIEKLEKEVRKKNIIVRGINDGKEVKDDEIKEEINKVIKTLRIDIDEKVEICR